MEGEGTINVDLPDCNYPEMDFLEQDNQRHTF